MATSPCKSTELPQTEQETLRRLRRIKDQRAKLDQEEFGLRMHLGVFRAAYKRR